jgi:DNA-binding transcriptional LysR family regulator
MCRAIRPILDDIEEAESAFRGARPRGLLRVDVQGTQARRFIVPALPRLFAAYPDLELFMGEGDRFVDIVREGIDCVLRAGEPKESHLIARSVAIRSMTTMAQPHIAISSKTATTPNTKSQRTVPIWRVPSVMKAGP